MSYAQGHTYFDSDSHVMEPLDWLKQHATLEEVALLGDMSLGAAGRFVEETIAKADARRADPHATAKLLETPIIQGPKGWAAYGASAKDERSRALDLLGFKCQLIFPTFCLNQFARSPNVDTQYAGASALNRAMSAFCADDRRLLGVGYLPLRDAKRSIATIETALAQGIRGFWVSSEPAGERSPAHLDVWPVWECLADKEVPIFLHIGGGRLLYPAYHENGHPRPTDFLGGGENLRAKDFPALAHSPQNFLNAMILDGVFERFEALRCGVIEIGANWVPGFMRILDQAAATFRKTEPLLEKLRLEPSEYMRRQVKFSLFPHDDAGWLIAQGGDELFMFASDYPHPEGSRDPIRHFDASLDQHHISEQAREKFRWQNMADLMGKACVATFA